MKTVAAQKWAHSSKHLQFANQEMLILCMQQLKADSQHQFPATQTDFLKTDSYTLITAVHLRVDW